MTPDTQAPVVQVEALHKVFPDFWRRPRVRAVNGVSFDIRRGEVFGLLGPNGSGKSTTIKMLLGLLHPTRGRIAVLGANPRDVKAKERIGYLPEESFLHPFLTAAETLHFYGRLHDLGKAERARRADQLLEMVGLGHTGRRRVGEFSKGMMRRVGLAAALINDPDFLVLDEPTSGLDPIGCRQMKDLILTLARRGKTILLTSHLLSDVEDVCDRIAILYGGQVQALGPIRDLLQVRSRVDIRLPELDGEKLEAVLASLRSELGAEPDVQYPSMDLEAFFMSVVEKARKAGVEASGAAHSGGVASYLSAPAPAAVLQELSRPEPVPTPAAPSVDAGPSSAPDRAEVEARLRRLTGSGEDPRA